MEYGEEFLERLSQLSPEEEVALDCEFTQEELTVVVNQLASGQAPGIGGLSAGVSGIFLDLIRMLLLECFREGISSCYLSAVPA